MNGRIQYIRVCEVKSVSDDTGCDYIKVVLHPFDDNKTVDELPLVFPLMPKLLHIKPKVGESVFVFLSEINNNESERYYIGPIISQANKLYYEQHLEAISVLNGAPLSVGKNPSMIAKTNGVFPDDDDVTLNGRKNADIQITDDDVRIKAGVKLVNEEEKNDVKFNVYDPAYIKVKYHPHGLVKKNVKSVSYDGNKNFNVEFDETKQVNSTVTIVGDKINLLSNQSDEITFKPTDPVDLITDENIKKAINEAYKLPYGEKLVEILQIFINAFIKHTHPFIMCPPSNANGIPELIEKKAILIDDEKLLSDTVRFN